jgi:hypothetical protein
MNTEKRKKDCIRKLQNEQVQKIKKKDKARKKERKKLKKK